MIEYIKVYENSKVRVSYKNAEGFAKQATGKIIMEDSKSIIMETIKKEKPTIFKDSITNIDELEKRKDGRQGNN